MCYSVELCEYIKYFNEMSTLFLENCKGYVHSKTLAAFLVFSIHPKVNLTGLTPDSLYMLIEYLHIL